MGDVGLMDCLCSIHVEHTERGEERQRRIEAAREQQHEDAVGMLFRVLQDGSAHVVTSVGLLHKSVALFDE